MATVGGLVISLALNTVGLSTGLAKAEAQLAAFQAQVTGQTAKAAGGFPIVASAAGLAGAAFVAAGLGAVHAGALFEYQMKLIRTQAGATAEELKRMSEAVLQLAPQVGIGPEELAKGLFHIESVGIRGAQALDVLRVAAEGARVGNADLETVTNALVAVVKSGISDVDGMSHGVTDMTQAMGILNGVVGTGNLRLQDLSNSLSSGVLSTAKQFGISVQQVGAALADMADQGIPAEEGATRLRITIALLGAPTKIATQELSKIGLTQRSLADEMRGPAGLIGALRLLKDHMDAAGLDATQQSQLLKTAFGGSRSSAGILTLINSLTLLDQKFSDIKDKSGSFATDWEEQSKTAAQSFADLKAAVEVLAIRIGNFVLPVAATFANILTVIASENLVLIPLFGALFVVVTSLAAKAFLRLGVVLLEVGRSFLESVAKVGRASAALKTVAADSAAAAAAQVGLGGAVAASAEETAAAAEVSSRAAAAQAEAYTTSGVAILAANASSVESATMLGETVVALEAEMTAAREASAAAAGVAAESVIAALASQAEAEYGLAAAVAESGVGFTEFGAEVIAGTETAAGAFTELIAGMDAVKVNGASMVIVLAEEIGQLKMGLDGAVQFALGLDEVSGAEERAAAAGAGFAASIGAGAAAMEAASARVVAVDSTLAESSAALAAATSSAWVAMGDAATAAAAESARAAATVETTSAEATTSVVAASAEQVAAFVAEASAASAMAAQVSASWALMRAGSWWQTSAPAAAAAPVVSSAAAAESAAALAGMTAAEQAAALAAGQLSLALAPVLVGEEAMAAGAAQLTLGLDAVIAATGETAAATSILTPTMAASGGAILAVRGAAVTAAVGLRALAASAIAAYGPLVAILGVFVAIQAVVNQMDPDWFSKQLAEGYRKTFSAMDPSKAVAEIKAAIARVGPAAAGGDRTAQDQLKALRSLLPEFKAAAMADGQAADQGLAQGLADGQGSVVDATKTLVETFGTTLVGVEQAAEVAGGDAMMKMAQEIQAHADAPANAFKAAVELQKTALSPAAETARLVGILQSQQLADGINSSIPAVVSAWTSVQKESIDRFDEIVGPRAWEVGHGAGVDFGKGLSASLAKTIDDATKQVSSGLTGLGGFVSLGGGAAGDLIKQSLAAAAAKRTTDEAAASWADYARGALSSRAALQSFLATLKTTGATSASVAAGLVNMARSARQAVNALAAAIKGGETSVSEAAAALVARFGQNLGALTAIGRSAGADLMTAVAQGIAAQREAPLNALRALHAALANEWNKARQVAFLLAALAGKDMARGLASADPTVRAAAYAARVTIINQLNALTGGAYSAGLNGGRAFAAGILAAIKVLTPLSKGFFGFAINPILATLQQAAAGFQVIKQATSGIYPTQGNKDYLDFLKTLDTKAKTAGNSLKNMAAAARSALTSAFDAIKAAAHKFFDALHEKNLRAIKDARDHKNALIDEKMALIQKPVTAAQKALDFQRAEQEEARLRRAVAEAMDPAARQEALLALQDFLAQRKIDEMQSEVDAEDAVLEAQKKANDKLYDQQVAAEDKRYAQQKADFDRQLTALERYLRTHPAAWRKVHNEILALLRHFGVSYANVGHLLGTAFESALKKALDKAVADAIAAAKAIARALGGKAKITTTVAHALGAWNLPTDEVAQLHAHEMVLRPDLADATRDLLGARGMESIPYLIMLGVGAENAAAAPIAATAPNTAAALIAADASTTAAPTAAPSAGPPKISLPTIILPKISLPTITLSMTAPIAGGLPPTTPTPMANLAAAPSKTTLPAPTPAALPKTLAPTTPVPTIAASSPLAGGHVGTSVQTSAIVRALSQPPLTMLPSPVVTTAPILDRRDDRAIVRALSRPPTPAPTAGDRLGTSIETSAMVRALSRPLPTTASPRATLARHEALERAADRREGGGGKLVVMIGNEKLDEIVDRRLYVRDGVYHSVGPSGSALR